ncbi:hypothetical protein D3C87_1701580 [compost metagenome]
MLVVIRRLSASDYLTAVEYDDRNGMNAAAGEIELTLTHFVGIQIRRKNFIGQIFRQTNTARDAGQRFM